MSVRVQDADEEEEPNDIKQMESEELLPTSASQEIQYATLSATAAGKTLDGSVQYQEVDCKATKVIDLACSSTSTCI